MLRQPVLEVKSLLKRHLLSGGGVLELLGGICFSFFVGERVAILGGNGCGKSTLLKILNGLEHPTSGSVEYCSKLDIRYLAQSISEYRGNSLTVCEQVNLGYLPLGSERSVFELLSGAAARERASRLLVPFHLGLEGRLDEWMGVLSGGQAQAVMLAGLLGGRRPDLLLLDEHAASLDELAGRAILKRLLALSAEGTCIAFVSHNSELVASFADRSIMLPSARILAG